MVEVFREVRRILRNDGTLWLNLGDSYAGNNSQSSNNGRAGYGNPRERIVNRMGEGLKPKDLIGIPWRVAFALQSDGWWLRQDIIWHKPNPMPESVTDRCTKAHEYIFLLSKSERYYYDHEAINEQVVNMGNPRKFRDAKENSDKTMRHDNGRLYIPKETRNKRSVWTVATKPYAEAHFATYPTKLIEPCILAGSPVGGVVFDPFTGSGTTALVALTNNRSYIGTELNPEYIRIAENRLSAIQPKMELV
jgi:DNA modification methylase